MNAKTGRRWSIQRTSLFCEGGVAITAALLDLLDRVHIEGRIRRVLADADDRVADIVIGWHRQIVRRRHALEDPAREVVARAVARTEIATIPIGAEAAARLRH